MRAHTESYHSPYIEWIVNNQCLGHFGHPECSISEYTLHVPCFEFTIRALRLGKLRAAWANERICDALVSKFISKGTFVMRVGGERRAMGDRHYKRSRGLVHSPQSRSPNLILDKILDMKLFTFLSIFLVAVSAIPVLDHASDSSSLIAVSTAFRLQFPKTDSTRKAFGSGTRSAAHRCRD